MSTPPGVVLGLALLVRVAAAVSTMVLGIVTLARRGERCGLADRRCESEPWHPLRGAPH